MGEARALSEPYLFNHAVRSWLFAAQLAELQSVSYEEGLGMLWAALWTALPIKMALSILFAAIGHHPS